MQERKELIRDFIEKENIKIKKETRDRLTYILQDIYELERQVRWLEDVKEELASRERDFEIALTEYWGVVKNDNR